MLRPATGSGTIGAFELNATTPALIVTNDNSAGTGSLSYVVSLANNTTEAKTITFDDEYFKTPRVIYLTDQLIVKAPLTITGPGAGLVTLYPASGKCHIYVDGDYSTVFSGLALTGLGSGGAENGGIYSDGAVTVNDCVIKDCYSTGNGGGIYTAGNNALIMNGCTVSNNTAGNHGGGIYARGPATLSGCNVSNNSSSNQGGGCFFYETAELTGCKVSGNSAADNGGGVIIRKTSVFNGCAVSNNTGKVGGGIYADDEITMSGCTVSLNTASGRNTGNNAGGGVYADTIAGLANCTVSGNLAQTGNGGGIYAGDRADLRGCTISGNRSDRGGSAGGGGGLYTDYANLVNCTVSGNASSANGGGICISARLLSTVKLTSCTVSGNSSTGGGGIFAGAGNHPTLLGTVIAGNYMTDGTQNEIEFSSGGGGIFNGNGFYQAAGSTANGTSADSARYILGIPLFNLATLMETTTANVNPFGSSVNRTVGLLKDNGGETLTILPSVYMADRVSSIFYTAWGATTDQRGVNRPAGGAGVDGTIGAVETNGSVPYALTVTNDDSAGTGSLSWAVGLVNCATAARTVTFDSSYFSTSRSIYLERQLDIRVPVTFTGPGADKVTVYPAYGSRHFNVTNNVAVALSGMTLTGFGTGGGINGGIASSGSGNVTLTNSTVSNCYAGDSVNGGGIQANTGIVTLSGCTVSGNSARFGGGVSSFGTASITNCTVSGNSAGASGGGIYNNSTGGVTLTTCTVSGNVADVSASSYSGGGIYANAVTLRGSVVAGNYRANGSQNEIYTNGAAQNGAGGLTVSGSAPFAGSEYYILGVPTGGLGTLMETTTKNIAGSRNVGLLKNNGGTTQTILPVVGSPMIGAVPADRFIAWSTTADQRGTSRSATVNGTVGAVDVGASITAAPLITVQPQGLTLAFGQTGTPLSVTASVSDGGTLSYQWHSNTTNSNTGGAPIPGAADSTYTPPATAIGTRYYYVVVTNTNDAKDIKTNTTVSAAAAVTVTKGAQTAPSFANTADINKIIGDGTFSLPSVSGGESTGAYSYRSDDGTVATVNASGQVTVVGAGTANIYVKRLGDDNYNDSAECNTPVRVIVSADKTVLNILIIQAQDKVANSTYGDKNGDYPGTAKDALELAILAAQAVSNNAAASQGTVDTAADALRAAISDFNDAKIIVDYTSLQTLLDTAENALSLAIGGDGDGQTPTAAMEALQDAIDAAQLVADDDHLSQATVDAAYDALAQALADFGAALVSVDFDALDAKIAEARAIARRNYTPTTWNILQTAITRAGTVRGTLHVTQAAVDAQVAALTAAIAGLRTTPGTQPQPDEPPDDTIPDTDTPLDAPLPFEDVHEGDWFYEAIYYGWINGLFNGTSANLFSPNAELTRGMAVTVLYRMAGEPDVTGLEIPFGDVPEGVWYTGAVKWGADNGIVLGYPDGDYRPDQLISRQELAALLVRYVDFAEIELPVVHTDYPGFLDDASIAGYAKEAIERCYKAGIIEGKPGGIVDPKGDATRAEFAMVVYRVLVTVEED